MITQADKEQAEWAASQPMAKTISRDTLTAFLVGKGIKAPINLFDDDYSLPSPGWIAHEFSSAWASDLNAFSLRYEPESWDCDDFAAGARLFAQILHKRTPRPDVEPSALALGEFAYRVDGGGGHAICVAVWRENGLLQLGFFEPQPATSTGSIITQTMQPKSLSQCEIQSCYFCRF